jgi:regulator of sirC expression with transglutaminase-like and TPR domain
MEATRRFAELMTSTEVPLDEAALLIAAHDHAVDIGAELGQLDALAGPAPDDPDALARYLFVEHGFAGDTTNYYDPRNSFLDEVMRRHRGIPISLSVVMLEIGRRRGVPLTGIGMPGHFLVRSAPGVFYDPFHGGERLDEGGAAARFMERARTVPFSERYLDPVDHAAILARMLANLIATFVPRDPVRATWALRLRLSIPGISRRSTSRRRNGRRAT